MCIALYIVLAARLECILHYITGWSVGWFGWLAGSLAGSCVRTAARLCFSTTCPGVWMRRRRRFDAEARYCEFRIWCRVVNGFEAELSHYSCVCTIALILERNNCDFVNTIYHIDINKECLNYFVTIYFVLSFRCIFCFMFMLMLRKYCDSHPF